MSEFDLVDIWIYATGPVDNWEGWAEFPEAYLEDCPARFVEDKKAVLWAKELLLKESSWEGDSRERLWRISALPDPSFAMSRRIIAVKQDNNGTCFFVSPFQLPHLEQDGCLERSLRVSVGFSPL